MRKCFRAQLTTPVKIKAKTLLDLDSVCTFAAEKESANDPVLYDSGEAGSGTRAVREEVTARSAEDGRIGGSVQNAPPPMVFSSRETRGGTVERGSGTGLDRNGVADDSKYHSNRTPSMVFSSRRLSGREAGQWV